MSKVVVKLSILLIGISTQKAILLLFKTQTWTLVFFNTRIARSRDTLLLYTEYKDQDTSNTIVLIRSNIIVTLPSATRQISKLTHLDLKWNKISHALISSNAWITKESIKLTQTPAHSRGIDLTKNSISRSIKKSRRLRSNQFTQL